VFAVICLTLLLVVVDDTFQKSHDAKQTSVHAIGTAAAATSTLVAPVRDGFLLQSGSHCLPVDQQECKGTWVPEGHAQERPERGRERIERGKSRGRERPKTMLCWRNEDGGCSECSRTWNVPKILHCLSRLPSRRIILTGDSNMLKGDILVFLPY
jgi:hypothetical protein